MNIVEARLAAKKAGGCLPVQDPALEQHCPNLYQYLTVNFKSGSKDRVMPEIVINRVPGLFQAVLKDHVTCEQIEAYAATWDGLAPALEAALTAEAPAWKPMKSYRNPRGLEAYEEGGTGRRKKKS